MNAHQYNYNGIDEELIKELQNRSNIKELNTVSNSEFFDRLYRPGDLITITLKLKNKFEQFQRRSKQLFTYRVKDRFFVARYEQINETINELSLIPFLEQFGDGGMFFTPTVSGKWVKKAENSRPTYRGKLNMVSFPYFVLECDDVNISKNKQLEVILNLFDKLNICSIVDSGNKSVHVLVKNFYPTHTELAHKEIKELNKIIPNIFDNHGLRLINGSRMVNMTRIVDGQKRFQHLLYLK